MAVAGRSDRKDFSHSRVLPCLETNRQWLVSDRDIACVRSRRSDACCACCGPFPQLHAAERRTWSSGHRRLGLTQHRAAFVQSPRGRTQPRKRSSRTAAEVWGNHPMLRVGCQHRHRRQDGGEQKQTAAQAPAPSPALRPICWHLPAKVKSGRGAGGRGTLNVMIDAMMPNMFLLHAECISHDPRRPTATTTMVQTERGRGLTHRNAWCARGPRALFQADQVSRADTHAVAQVASVYHTSRQRFPSAPATCLSSGLRR